MNADRRQSYKQPWLPTKASQRLQLAVRRDSFRSMSATEQYAFLHAKPTKPVRHDAMIMQRWCTP